MTPERWREVEQVYQSTMDREPEVRAAFLSEACAGDEELRREVDSLLELNHSPVLVDAPAWQAVAELLDDSNQLASGTQLGRTVALKISRDVVQSFFGLSDAGLYQIKFHIPAGLGNRNIVLAATVGGVSTQPSAVISLQ